MPTDDGMLRPTQLTPHFALREFGAVPESAWGNVRMLARLLEHIRALCGNAPIDITSGYREGDPNQHGNGSAADFTVLGVGCASVGRRIREAMDRGDMPVFGQVILYPYERFHVHASIANRRSGKTNEILVCVRKADKARGWLKDKYMPWNGRGLLPRDENPPS